MDIEQSVRFLQRERNWGWYLETVFFRVWLDCIDAAHLRWSEWASTMLKNILSCSWREEHTSCRKKLETKRQDIVRKWQEESKVIRWRSDPKRGRSKKLTRWRCFEYRSGIPSTFWDQLRLVYVRALTLSFFFFLGDVRSCRSLRMRGILKMTSKVVSELFSG